jgi:hypothetical protein
MAAMRALAIAALAAACGGPTQAAAPADDLGYLVWTAAPSQTIWFDADGAERGRADGVWIRTDETLWRLEERTVSRVTTGCELGGGDRPPPGRATAALPTLLSADRQTRVVPWPTELEGTDEYATWDERTVVVASLGDRLFFLDYTDAYACGAHGNQGVAAATYDLPARRLTSTAPRPAEPRLAALADAALTEPVDRLDADGWQIGATVPSWTGDRLGARHLVFVSTCYACGNGEWSSYTWGQWIEDVRLPDDWPRPDPPPAVRAALIGDSPRGLSWGLADATWRATFTPR